MVECSVASRMVGFLAAALVHLFFFVDLWAGKTRAMRAVRSLSSKRQSDSQTKNINCCSKVLTTPGVAMISLEILSYSHSSSSILRISSKQNTPRQRLLHLLIGLWPQLDQQISVWKALQYAIHLMTRRCIL